MNKPFFLMLAAIVLPVITATTSLGQETIPRPTPAADAPAVSDQDLNLFRKDVRSLKKQIVALNMNLTDDEAVKFWPVYDRYSAELTTLYDQKYAVLRSYAANYDSLTSEQGAPHSKYKIARALQ